MSFLRASLYTLLICLTTKAAAQGVDSAQYYFDRGKLLDNQYEYDSAVLFYERSKSLFTPGTLGEAKACHALGDIYKYVLYDFDKAESNYERALAIQQGVGPSDTKNLTRLYYNLATTNRSQHDYETAIIWCMKAVDGCKKMNDNVFLERAYSIVGNIYRDMHLFDSAVAYYEKGVTVNQSINKGRVNETLAGLYGGWADASYRTGNVKDAIDKFNDALNIYQKVGTSDKLIYLHTALLLAEVQIGNSNLEAASKALQLADNIRKDLGLERGGPPSSMNKIYGDYMLAKNDNISAYGYYQKAIQAATTEPLGRDGNPKDLGKIDFKSFAYVALLAKAAVVEQADKLECYKLAERIMVASRSELDTEEAKWSYVDANYRLYENILRTLFQSTRRDTASLLYFMESSKSKTLADALHEVELRKVMGKGDTLLTKLRALKQRSLSLQHQIDSDNDTTAREQLLTNSQKISALEAAINAKYPSYLQTSVSLPALIKKLRSLDAAFIEYFWGEDNIYALVVSSAGVEFHQLPAPEGLFEYLEMFKTRGNQYSPQAVSGFRQRSNQLYASLIQPFRDRLTGKRLVIVPDGPLMQLPFETLVTDQTGDSYNNLSYLLKDFIVSYTFSGSFFANHDQKPKANPSLLAFGFTGGAAERSTGQSNTEIAGSESELIALSGKFPDGTFLYGDGVTEEKFKNAAADFDLLHLAVHGSGDTGEDYSATLYFRDKDGPEDGKLYWYELYNMNLRASLAVLSSCESGIGKTYRGEGMLSMANAFTFAGCSNIVMGLWKVDDQVSVKLMDTFYSELLNGMAIDEALAMAKRTYLATADQISANPKLWGSLVAYGESPILRADEIPTSWVVVALTVLAAGIVLLVIKTRKK